MACGCVLKAYAMQHTIRHDLLYVVNNLKYTSWCMRRQGENQMCSPQISANCNAPLVSKSCEKPCQPNCDDLEPECEGKCTSKYVCGCPDGYIRRNSTDSTCIKYEDCMSKRLGRSSVEFPRCSFSLRYNILLSRMSITVACSEMWCGMPVNVWSSRTFVYATVRIWIHMRLSRWI